MNTTRVPVGVPSSTDLTTMTALQEAFTNAALLPQKPYARLVSLLGTVPFALWIVPNTFGGIQIAVTIFATVMPFLVLFVGLREEKRNVDQTFVDLLNALQDAQIEARRSRESANEARQETMRARHDLEQLRLQDSAGAKHPLRSGGKVSRKPRGAPRARPVDAR